MAASIVVALLAMLAAWLSGSPPWLRSLLVAAAAAIWGLSLVRLLRPGIRSVLWRADGGVELTLHDGLADGGRETQGTLGGGRILGPLIVLTLRWPPRASTSIWLLHDNLDADTRRLLRMRLGTASGSHASGNADSG
jgi:hypothetical protein